MAVSVAAATLAAACAGRQGPSCPVSATAVSASVERLVAADNARDLEGVLSSYVDDVVWLPPAGPALQGKAAIRPRYEELFSRYAVELTSDTVEASAVQDLGFVRGSTRGTLRPLGGGAAITVDDKFLALVRCERGTWRVSHLTWSPRAGVE